MGARYLLTVRFLKTNSGKKGEGMPVVRNPQFYFMEGFVGKMLILHTLKPELKRMEFLMF